MDLDRGVIVDGSAGGGGAGGGGGGGKMKKLKGAPEKVKKADMMLVPHFLVDPLVANLQKANQIVQSYLGNSTGNSSGGNTGSGGGATISSGSSSSTAHSSSHSSSHSAARQPNLKIVEEGFVYFMVKLLGGFKSHLRLSSKKEGEGQEEKKGKEDHGAEFDMESFLQSRDPSVRDFISEISGSQLFNMFLQGYLTQYAGQHGTLPANSANSKK